MNCRQRLSRLESTLDRDTDSLVLVVTPGRAYADLAGGPGLSIQAPGTLLAVRCFHPRCCIVLDWHIFGTAEDDRLDSLGPLVGSNRLQRRRGLLVKGHKS